MFALEDIEIRILIVDDEPLIREALCQFLSETYQCALAASAEEALAKIEEEKFGVVISDINMPGMSGLEMISQIPAKSPFTSVIVITGQQVVDDAIQALRAGAFDYILKPFELLQVQAAVRRAAEHYELQIIKRRYDQHLEQLVAKRTEELNCALNEVEKSYRATLKALVQALETRDFETHGHSERVVTFSLRLGYELGLGNEQLTALEYGALLHDIGKIGVPDAILRKPAGLNDEEWIKMRLHPLHGQQILRGIPFLEAATRVVAQHHEKWDGSGYPLGLRGEAIDLNARIFSVADSFDAIVSDRVYRAGQSYENAAAALEKASGTQFDPEVVAAFHRVPKEDWEKLRKKSLQRKPEHFSFQAVVAELLDTANAAINSAAKQSDFRKTVSELVLEQP